VAGSAFNLGGGPGNALSLRELLRQLKDISGRNPLVSYHPWRPGDQRWYVSDTTAISQALGWSPKVNADSGLHRLADWVREAFAEAPAAQARKLAS
jgi:CDP-paratose 2-epimerase